MRRLEQWADSLPAGDRTAGAHLLMVGDPGVGKSALAAHAVIRARAAGSAVVRLVGLRSEFDLAFSVLHQLVDQLDEHLERLSPHQVEVLERALTGRHGERPDRLSVSDAVLDLMRRADRERPFVVLAEDVHWVDVPSAEVLTFLLRRLGAGGPRFLLTARTGRTGPIDTRDVPRMNDPRWSPTRRVHCSASATRGFTSRYGAECWRRRRATPSPWWSSPHN